jgi:ABC-type spermidine/putrescine transport system permease subunit II
VTTSWLGAIVDAGDLLQVVWASLVAGIGVTAAYGAAILGATRAVDLSRQGRPGEAAVFAALLLVGLAVVAAAVVYGIVVMTQK